MLVNNGAQSNEPTSESQSDIKALHHTLAALAYLHAPYLAVARQIPAPMLPLGSVICVATEDWASDVISLITASERWPWAIPCIHQTAACPELSLILNQIPRFADRLAVVEGARSALNIANAVRHRNTPTGYLMARYLSMRLGVREFEQIFDELFTRGAHGKTGPYLRSRSWYSRQLSKVGPLTAHDWQSIGEMTQVLGGLQSVSNSPDLRDVERLRRMRRYARKYLEMPWRAARVLLGWEWVIERTLRACETIT
jgi:hypothetical protein